MQALLSILQGHDRSSLLVGLCLGIVFTFAVMQTIEWLQRTYHLLVRETASARKKAKAKREEIREIEQGAQEARYSGCIGGGPRVLFYAIVASIVAWCILKAWRMSIP